jgi:hypothetical protein
VKHDHKRSSPEPCSVPCTSTFRQCSAVVDVYHKGSTPEPCSVPCTLHQYLSPVFGRSRRIFFIRIYAVFLRRFRGKRIYGTYATYPNSTELTPYIRPVLRIYAVFFRRFQKRIRIYAVYTYTTYTTYIRILQPYKCNRGWHTFCLNPNVSRNIEVFICPECIPADPTGEVPQSLPMPVSTAPVIRSILKKGKQSAEGKLPQVPKPVQEPATPTRRSGITSVYKVFHRRCLNYTTYTRLH